MQTFQVLNGIVAWYVYRFGYVSDTIHSDTKIDPVSGIRYGLYRNTEIRVTFRTHETLVLPDFSFWNRKQTVLNTKLLVIDCFLDQLTINNFLFWKHQTNIFLCTWAITHSYNEKYWLIRFWLHHSIENKIADVFIFSPSPRRNVARAVSY